MKELTRLKAKLVENKMTQEEFANKLGISKTSVNYKLNGESGFSRQEIKKACDLLKINSEDIGNYFFNI